MQGFRQYHLRVRHDPSTSDTLNLEIKNKYINKQTKRRTEKKSLKLGKNFLSEYFPRGIYLCISFCLVQRLN